MIALCTVIDSAEESDIDVVDNQSFDFSEDRLPVYKVDCQEKQF